MKMGLLKVGRGAIGSYFSQLLLAPGCTHDREGSGRAINVRGMPIATILSKTDAGELDGGVTEIPAQRRVKLEVGQVAANRCNPLVEINPALYEVADVQFRRIFEEQGLQDITLYMNTKQKVDLNELDWIVRIYAMA